jgi:hypothetical protein
MKLTRQIVDEKITPLLNYIFKLNLAEEGAHGGEGDHAVGGQEHIIVNQLIQQKMETMAD